MKLKFKLLDEKAVKPVKAHDRDAGYDLTATSIKIKKEYVQYGTSIAFDIPKGYAGLLFPRSSVTDEDLILKNSIGLIDSGYQGEIKFRFMPTTLSLLPEIYEVGDRIGQIVFIKLPEIELVESDEFEDSERGEGGYGSTNKKNEGYTSQDLPLNS